MASSPYPDPGSRFLGGLPSWLIATLVGLFALVVTGSIAALVAFASLLTPDEATNEQFLWRRLLEEPTMWIVAVPIGFAVLTVLLINLFRPQRRLRGMLVALAIVTMVSAIYVPIALALRPMFSWMVVLVPVLAIALFYAGMMYVRDAKSIHPLWAAFLGILRCLVYSILAVVFLLPGCQTFEQSTKAAKVMFLMDVSGSTGVIDDQPAPGQNAASLPTRQDKIIAFLTQMPDPKTNLDQPFLDRVLKNSDVVMYRFGKMVDEKEVQRVGQRGNLSAEHVTAWLKPDKSKINVDKVPEDKRGQARLDLEEQIDQLLGGTNIPGSLNGAMKLEINSYLQAIVVISDGNNNAGSDEALQEFLARANNPRRPIPVYTIGVGEYRTPISIAIEDLLAPEVVRPDDKFPIRVPVIGNGLGEETFTVKLEATRLITDDTGKVIGRDTKFDLGPKQGKFKGAGDHPTGTVEFEIDVQDLKKIRASEPNAGELEGQWEFVARVTRHPREAFAKEEHVSDPVKVLVQKKELRILLFAGGPTSEFKALRPLFFREQQQKRVELSVYLQSAVVDGHLIDHVDLDVDKDHVLVHFPNKRGEPTPGEKQYSLAEYDAIIAIDPDWTQLTKDQLKLLKEWVDKDAGGVVFVAGPVNTHIFARPGGVDISSLLSIYPVLPTDARLHGLNLGNVDITHDSTRPYTLHFTPAAKDYEFLRLDDKEDGPTSGWDTFFWAGTTPEPGKNPRRGFYNYYPIKKLKPDSAVIATFAGPPSTYFEDTDGKRKEQPFLVSMRYGGGKTVFLGAGEMWRLKVRQGFYERFWMKLARYVAAGSQMQKKYGDMYLPPTAAVGTITFEAKLRDTRLEPLAADSRPVLYVRRITDNKDEKKAVKFESKPRPVDDPKDWEGYFTFSAKVPEDGKYEFRIPIPGTPESIRREISIRKPNPEMDNVKNDFDYLYKIASEFKTIQNTLSPEVRKEVAAKLKAGSTGDGKESLRLFFTLQTADAISKCIRQIEPQREKIKGPLYDLWDTGIKTGLPAVNAYHFAWGVPMALGVLGFAILMFLRQTLYAGLFLVGTWLVSLLAAIAGLVFTLDWPDLPIDFSFVLIVVVALLSIEWLTRKLLKLA
jgi:hypothetical protein